MFTKAFFISAFEHALVAAVAAFTGSLTVTAGQPTVKGLEAAGVAAGMAFLYAFTKALGATQSAAGTLEVAAKVAAK